MALIYVVDADSSTQRELTRLLALERHEVRAYARAPDLLAALQAEAPDLVLTDLYLPGMEGVEVILRLAKAEPPIPVIALSGGAAEALFVVPDASHLGAAATLSKPIVPEEVVQTVRRVLGSRS